jgi:hypothetical protein
MKCCDRKINLNKPTNESCGSLETIDFSKYNLKGAGVLGGLLSRNYKDGCKILINYSQANFQNPPPNFFLFDYLTLKQFMREKGDFSLFANVEPTLDRDIYDEYMYFDLQASFYSSLAKRNNVEAQMKDIFAYFLNVTKCNKIKITYIANNLVDYDKINSENYDLFLTIELGNFHKKICKGRVPNEGVYAKTSFVGIPNVCSYFIPSNEKQTMLVSLNNGQEWRDLPILGEQNSLKTCDELFILLNNTFKDLIPFYTINFEKVNMPGFLPQKKFKLRMNISIKPIEGHEDHNPPLPGDIPNDFKSSSIRSFQFRTLYDILCFKKNIIYKISENDVRGILNDQEGYICDQDGSIVFPGEINMTATNKITMNVFGYSIFMHEFMHVLGFKHTHQVNSPLNPCTNATWTTPELRANYANFLLMDPVRDGPIDIQDFDPLSIMTYSLGPADNTRIPNRNIFFHRNFQLSPTDLSNLRQFYATPLPPPPPGPPPGGFFGLKNYKNLYSRNSLLFLGIILLLIIFYTILK